MPHPEPEPKKSQSRKVKVPAKATILSRKSTTAQKKAIILSRPLAPGPVLSFIAHKIVYDQKMKLHRMNTQAYTVGVL